MIVRIQFTKQGPVRFISHRDVARAWERAFRRARVPLAFSQGFAPHPKVSFGLALALGYESDAEYLDVTLAEPCEPGALGKRLSEVLPVGMAVRQASEIGADVLSVASQTQWADYLVALSGLDEGPPPAADAVAAALESLDPLPEWTVVRRRKGRAVPGDHEDLRARVALLSVVPSPKDGFGPVALSTRLATQPRVIRPDEVCELITAHCPEVAIAARLVRRTAQYFVVDGQLVDPFGDGASPSTHDQMEGFLHAEISSPS